MTNTITHNATSLPPPMRSRGVIGWVWENLFSTPLNGGLTLLLMWGLYQIVPPVADWLLFDATFSGDSRDACRANEGDGGAGGGGGACWVFVSARLEQFLYGFYPAAERWRVDLTALLLFVPLAALIIPVTPGRKWLALFLLLPFPVIAFILLYGGWVGLGVVETSRWGGLMLTLVVALTGIAASLPIGILLALGRRSDMPVVSTLCTAFIELWRGVPLITVLFMASVMLPLFLPEGVNFDKLLRALIGVSLFSAAYMAEVVRGGLQSVPRGQIEAARSLGLGYAQTMILIVLPQALKTVIPGIVNTFIGLFKDTTLVLIIGLFDVLGSVQAAATDPQWLGLAAEGYIFAAVVFWAFCFSMSRYSIYLEGKLKTDHG